MMLKGSCHCRAVRFSVRSETPYPYMWCCSICRKTAGGGGYAINIMGQAGTLKVKGRTRAYRPMRGGGERHFCPKCASWAEVPKRKGDRRFRAYPKEAIIDWHRRRGLLR